MGEGAGQEGVATHKQRCQTLGASRRRTDEDRYQMGLAPRSAELQPPATEAQDWQVEPRPG